MEKIILTGAGGRLASYLRKPLSKLCDNLVSTDRIDKIGNLNHNENYIKAELEDFDKINKILQNADMVVHFGGYPDEYPFEDILKSNIIGCYNVWEAAKNNNLKRVVYASSIHAVGMYPKNKCLDIDVPHRPDSYYGLAKCFAEDMARLYWDKKQLETVCLRILSCAKPTNPRSIGTWLSYDDLIHLVERSITTPVTGFSIIYGVSNNDRTPVDNSKSSFIGYRPKDNAEKFSETIFNSFPSGNPSDLDQMLHGGPFATTDLGESGVAKLGLSEDDN